MNHSKSVEHLYRLVPTSDPAPAPPTYVIKEYSGTLKPPAQVPTTPTAHTQPQKAVPRAITPLTHPQPEDPVSKAITAAAARTTSALEDIYSELEDLSTVTNRQTTKTRKIIAVNSQHITEIKETISEIKETVSGLHSNLYISTFFVILALIIIDICTYFLTQLFGEQNRK